MSPAIWGGVNGVGGAARHSYGKESAVRTKRLLAAAPKRDRRGNKYLPEGTVSNVEAVRGVYGEFARGDIQTVLASWLVCACPG
jgi:hypothetical protein